MPERVSDSFDVNVSISLLKAFFERLGVNILHFISESFFISRQSISCLRVSESFDVNIFHVASESFF